MPFVPAHDLLPPDSTGPLALVCHGILGSRRNWRTFVRRLAQELPGWRFALVDHRNHGESHGAPPPHTVEACAADLEALMGQIGPARIVVGHSFGGKVALALAARRPAGLEQVWSLDAAPGPLPGDPRDDHEITEVLGTLRSVPLPFARRADVLTTLEAHGLPPSLAQWMTTNLRRDPDGFRWQFDLEAAEAMIHDYFGRDLWGPVEATDDLAPDVEVVRAANSDRWGPATIRRFQQLHPSAAGRLHTLPDAGHWLHVDNPDGLRELLLEHWVR